MDLASFVGDLITELAERVVERDEKQENIRAKVPGRFSSLYCAKEEKDYSAADCDFWSSLGEGC